MKVKELLKLINDNNIDGNTKIKIAKSVQDGIYSGYSESVHTKHNVCNVEYFDKDEDKPERVVLYV